MSDIKGYRRLNDIEVELINELKAEGGRLELLAKKLLLFEADPRWVAIGSTDLQKGMMALTRAVAKPTNF